MAAYETSEQLEEAKDKLPLKILYNTANFSEQGKRILLLTEKMYIQSLLIYHTIGCTACMYKASQPLTFLLISDIACIDKEQAVDIILFS